jgi:hypothetical protein
MPGFKVEKYHETQILSMQNLATAQVYFGRMSKSNISRKADVKNTLLAWADIDRVHRESQHIGKVYLRGSLSMPNIGL